MTRYGKCGLFTTSLQMSIFGCHNESNEENHFRIIRLAFVSVDSHTSFSPAFDLYRCIAVLSIVVGHFVLSHPTITIWFRIPLLIPMNYGVPIFFLISGYLLAKSYRSIRLKTLSGVSAVAIFYRTRILRIYPAYLFWLLVLAALGPKDVKDIVAHLLNIHNFYHSYSHSINPVFWSLAVEFQWYILAPALIVLVMSDKLKFVILACSLSTILSLACRNVFIHAFFYSHLPLSELGRLGGAQIYVELYSFVLGIMIFRFRNSVFQLPQMVIVGIWLLLIGVSIVTFVVATSEEFMSTWLMTVIINLKYVSQFALAALMFHYRLIKIPAAILTPVHFIAVISYSLYLVHLPLLDWVNLLPYSLPAISFCYFFISCMIAFFSYQIIEKPTIDYARLLNTRFAHQEFPNLMSP